MPDKLTDRTDRELIVVAATRIMGWHQSPYGMWYGVPWSLDVSAIHCVAAREWDPTDSVSDAFILVAKMQERRLELTLHSMRIGNGLRPMFIFGKLKRLRPIPTMQISIACTGSRSVRRTRNDAR